MNILENIKNKLLVLGNNQDGCLLTGNKNDVIEFKYVQNIFLEHNSIFSVKFKIEAGMSSCSIFNDKVIYIWGRMAEELNVQFLKFEFKGTIDKIKIGDSHILFLLEGDVYSYGTGNKGELGIGVNLFKS